MAHVLSATVYWVLPCFHRVCKIKKSDPELADSTRRCRNCGQSSPIKRDRRSPVLLVPDDGGPFFCCLFLIFTQTDKRRNRGPSIHFVTATQSKVAEALLWRRLLPQWRPTSVRFAGPRSPVLQHDNEINPF